MKRKGKRGGTRARLPRKIESAARSRAARSKREGTRSSQREKKTRCACKGRKENRAAAEARLLGRPCALATKGENLDASRKRNTNRNISEGGKRPGVIFGRSLSTPPNLVGEKKNPVSTSTAREEKKKTHTRKNSRVRVDQGRQGPQGLESLCSSAAAQKMPISQAEKKGSCRGDRGTLATTRKKKARDRAERREPRAIARANGRSRHASIVRGRIRISREGRERKDCFPSPPNSSPGAPR